MSPAPHKTLGYVWGIREDNKLKQT